MEIFSYVTEGALEHRDSMGNGSVLRRGDVQLMSAGTGVLHSEFNPQPDAPTHLFQIWIRPSERGLTPNYQERRFEDAELADRLRVVVSPDGRDGSLVIRQDATIHAGRLAAGAGVTHWLSPGRHAWLQVLSGAVTLNGTPLATGDGASTSDPGPLLLVATEDAEALLFDLA
jgi:redox-sensitive bicupin YhaK (pirin superfamily)